jgi:hypothetical protein
MAMMVVAKVVGGQRYRRTPHNQRGRTPCMKPGKNGHAAGIGHSGGHTPQNGVMRQNVQTTQHRHQPDLDKRVASHDALEQEGGYEPPVQGEPKSRGTGGL